MSKLIYFGMFLLTILSCKTNSIVTNSEVKPTSISNDLDKLSYFIASGTEPFWNISISEDRIIYKTPEDSIIIPHTEPMLAMDANAKMYKIKTEAAQFNIEIFQQECINDMSGDTLPYKVTVEFKKNNASKFETIRGCGQYITDYRLHDIWVLEELNGKRISSKDFGKEFPRIEIYANTNKFLGFSGCNEMNGSLFFEKGRLKFINIATTKMKCENSNKESEFLNTLQSTITYSIGNNRLILTNPSGKKLVFKKVD